MNHSIVCDDRLSWTQTYTSKDENQNIVAFEFHCRKHNENFWLSVPTRVGELKTRILTYDERRLWGICSICGANAGVACSNSIYNGVHSSRLQAAPYAIRETAIMEQINDSRI